jgi:flagellar biosynthesis/type III secretory pathway chaperone
MPSLAKNNTTSLPFSWEDLMGLLRDELEEYGNLIGLLTSQQQSILERRTENIQLINQSVQTQMEANQILQNRRNNFVDSFASSLGVENSSTLSELIPHFPAATQPMFESIVEEINNLITLIRNKIAQNQRLLFRLSEVTDQILSISDPSSHSKTYSNKGEIRSLAPHNINLNESA